MLLSLAIPGAAQARLGRTKATYLFGGFELASIFMLEKSAADLRAAKRARADSVPVFTTDSLGVARITSYTQNRLAVRIPARRTHYEDWIAALVFNHLIAAADAYVAANLWDFKAQITGGAGPDGTTIGASVAF